MAEGGLPETPPVLLTRPLAFIELGRPTDKEDAALRRRIRSHVTTVQHARARQRKTHKADSVVPRKETPREEKTKNGTPRIKQDDDLEEETSLQAPLLLNRRFTTGSDAFRLFVLDDPDNTTGSCFTSLNTDVQAILDHYAYIILSHTPDVEAAYNGAFHPDGIPFATWYIPYFYSDPALLASVILISAGRRTYDGYDTRAGIAFLRLRDFVIVSLGKALKDPSRALSDQIILAVVVLAAFEVVFGYAASYELHMAGAARMIKLQKDSEVSMSEPVRRLLDWFDDQTSNIAGLRGISNRRRMFPKISAGKPDVGVFTLGVDTHDLWIGSDDESPSDY